MNFLEKEIVDIYYVMVFPGKGISPFRVYLVLLIFLIFNSICDTTKKKKERTTLGPNQKRICLNSDSDNSIRGTDTQIK